MEWDSTNNSVTEVWTKGEATKNSICIKTKQPNKSESNASTMPGQSSGDEPSKMEMS